MRPYRIPPHPRALRRLTGTPLDEHRAVRVRDDVRFHFERSVGELQPREHRVWAPKVVDGPAVRGFGEAEGGSKRPAVSSSGHVRTVGPATDTRPFDRRTARAVSGPTPHELLRLRYSVAAMTGSDRRSLLERLVGRPLPWLVWAWAVLAVIWIVIDFVEPSAFHTFMAIAWTVLAAAQLGTAYYARRQRRNRARDGQLN